MGSAYFYEPKSVFIFDSVVQVWGKTIYSEKARQYVIRKFGARYKKLDHSLILYRIDCLERKFQILEGINYALDGSILDVAKSFEFLAEWDFIPPGSVAEKILEEICVIEK